MHSKTLSDDGQINRNKGTMSKSGKILKGIINEASYKLNLSSIPSKYQNSIQYSHGKPAFGDSTKKFFNLSANDSSLNPGPGSYNLENSFTKVDSKKGSGFFASQTKLQKLQRSRSHGPGPATYKLGQIKSRPSKKLKFSKFKLNQSTLSNSKSTALISSKIQTRQIFKMELQNSKTKPSVGTYQVNPQKTIRKQNLYSNFKSKTDRFSAHQKNQVPPIGAYEIPKSNHTKSLVNFTKKFENPKSSKFTEQKNLHKAFKKLQEIEQREKLGPGTYDPTFRSTSKTFKIKDNMFDRFGELKTIYKISENEQTNQKRQQIKNVVGQQSKFHKTLSKTYNSVFKSTTGRWDFKLKNKMDPGIYNANKSSPKKSHLINFFQKWV